MNVATINKAGTRWVPSAPAVDLLLAGGGDERIAPDPATRRNRYGTTPAPAPREIFFSSSTASTITPRSYRAVAAAWERLASGAVGPAAWFDDLRARLRNLFGLPGCEVVLTGSGTEAELTTLALARSALEGPLTNIVIAPTETGSAVPRAASGAHFLETSAFGGRGAAGARLQGWADWDIEVAGVDIRDAAGRPRAAADIDGETEVVAAAALAGGRNVLLHCLETSKTGLSGLTPAVAARIRAAAPDRVAVIVDCCQLRCSREHVRRMLRQGFMVAVTGSKFFGGPPFSGALFIPAGLLEGFGRCAPPKGLADYSSRLDWPPRLRDRLALEWSSDANLGLGLRWVAALSEMQRYFATPEPFRRAVLLRFEQAVRDRAAGMARLEEIAGGAGAISLRPKGILGFAMSDPDGAPFSAAQTAAVHAQLRSPGDSGEGDPALRRIFHVGQPVAVGSRWALRVCAGAPLVGDVAERMQRGAGLDAAFAPWERRLEALFQKWAALMGAP